MKHILEEFKDRVQTQPNDIAIVTTNGDEYTYKDVDIIVSNLASYFNGIGVNRGDIVPLLMKRDEFVIFTTMALFSMGAAYTPIAESYPKERIDYILAMFSKRILLTNFNVKKDTFPEDVQVVNVTKKIYRTSDERFDYYSLDDLAYVLFTSGSTGKPKGVEITHRNLAWILNEIQDKFPQVAGDSYLFDTPYTFDVSVTEMYGWMVAGTKLIVPCMQEDELAKDISRIIEEMNVTHLAMSPSFMKMLIDINVDNGVAFYKKLKYVFLAGEAFPAELAVTLRKISKSVRLCNLYGPTETSVYVTHYEVTDNDTHVVPIGKPFSGIVTKVMRDGAEATIGEKGELYVGGAGVCRGYYENKQLTDEKICTIDGERYYKTGDYVYKNENGDFVYVERIDEQVQLNGIRVELGEIESTLAEKMNFRGCKVLYYEKRLICFYLNDYSVDSQEIFKILKGTLPKYMVPKIYIHLDSFPLNASRKISKEQLLVKYEEYINNHLSSESDEVEGDKTSKLQKDIIEAIKKYCKIDVLNPNADLLEIGMDSLEMLSIIVTLEDKWGVKLPNDLFYMMSTVSEVQNYVSANCHVTLAADDTSKKSTSNTLDEAIENIKEAVTKDLKEWNEEIVGRYDVKQYNTLYLQKVYHYDNFESFINVDIEIQNGKYSLKNVSEGVGKLINQHELLRSILREDNGLFFVEKEATAVKKNLKEYPENYEAIITETAIEYLKKNRLEHILFYPYIVRDDRTYHIKFIISHKIMDQKSSYNLKRDFYNFMKGVAVEERANYEQFIKSLESKNNNGCFGTNDHVAKLLTIKSHPFKNYNDENIFSIRFELKSEYSSEEQKITDILGTILEKVLLASDQESCIASTILNYRVIDGCDYGSCIGDYHTAIVFPYYLESVGHKNIVEDIMRLYKNGYQPQQYVFKDYPQMSEEQKKLEYAFDLNVFASINYLGEIREDELTVTKEGLYNTRKELSKFPGKKMYITCFTIRGICYAYFLTAPEGMRDYCIN